MTKIKKLAEHMMNEVCGAKEYAEAYVEAKARGDAPWANRYKDMANDELKHANYIHELAVKEIEELKKAYTNIPEEMQDKWDEKHKKYVEKVAWIKQMLTM